MTKVVAPLAGSVDRNFGEDEATARRMVSLPSRGAWIEMGICLPHLIPTHPSLPSRGAWIEIWMPAACPCRAAGRSPRGERG